MKQFKSQSGRSMVEMLGVLAIVGVLSIGGIMGYSYGMDKYRANEATNQIMLRAIDLMTQASNNNAELSLAAWENEETQYTIGEVGNTYDGLIYLDIAGLPKNICEIVYDNMSSMAVQIDINAVRSLSNETCGDDNEMTFYFEGGISGTCDPACPEGQYCDNGICFKGGMPEITRGAGECSGYSDDCGDPCYYCSYGGSSGYRCIAHAYAACTIDGKDGLCRGGECYPKGDGCTTNDDCTEPGTYCASTNSSDKVRFQSAETGSCVPLDFVRREFGGETYYISNYGMTWWDAEYACAAIGKTVGKNIKMVEVTDLVEASTWNGSSDGNNVATSFGLELYSLVRTNFFWTQNFENGEAFGVGFGGTNAYVYRARPHEGALFVICR